MNTDNTVGELLREDIALLVMSATAFNMGIRAREDRDQESIDRLRAATQRVTVLFGIVFSEEDFDDTQD